MAKDYFQDIVPPSHSSHTRHKKHHAAARAHDEPADHAAHSTESGDRSIRNISIQRATPRRAGELRDTGHLGPARRRRSRWMLWVLAALALLTLGALALVALRPTSVTIIPRTHTITFDGEQFSAVPAGAAVLGALEYAVETVVLEDSEVVPSEGTVYAEDKASGNIVVYNDHQTSPLTLVRNTRFTSASGHVFRTPADIVVPGKQGSTPGRVEVTVVADKAGAEYNIAPGRFTLPGLQSTPDMYRNVYAESTTAFSGGFVGERPGVAAGALESAIGTTRARLESKARAAIAPRDGSLAFAELATIDYESLPHTTEAGGGLRIHEKATVRVPTFDISEFLATVAATAIDATDASAIDLVPAGDFRAAPAGTPGILGSDNLNFSLTGSARLVWDIPVEEVRQALAGKDQAAFESIIGTFNAVQEAKARIEPFWKGVFPADPADIRIKVQDPSGR